MKREMRSRRVYEYPRGGLYRESNAEQQSWTLANNGGQGGPPGGHNGAGRGGGGGRGRGGPTRGGGSNNGAGRGGGASTRAPQPEKYSAGYDPVRNPDHVKEKIGMAVYNRELARAGGKQEKHRNDNRARPPRPIWGVEPAPRTK